MPVHAVRRRGQLVGYQWGQHGHLYPTREGAQAQARAIYAAGYREDAPGRAARRRLARALKPSRAAEEAYVRALRGLLRGVHEGLMGLIDREILPSVQTRQDANACNQLHEDADGVPPDHATRVLTPRVRAKIGRHLEEKTGPAFDSMAEGVDARNREGLTLLGIPMKDAEAGVEDAIAEARAWNLDLVDRAGNGYFDDVVDVLTDPANEGLRVEELRDLLLKRGSVSESRAQLIAVDQTLKLHASLTEVRQTEAGVTSYRWSTSLDERVRPMHAELEGQAFDWDDPPITNEDGDTNHPGNDYRCRCLALPIIPELEAGASTGEGEPDDVDEPDDLEAAAE